MSDFFEQAIFEIEQAYQELGYTLGWRFLNCSKRVLYNNPKIIFINLNPGGSEISKYHPMTSCEEGHSYLYEKWGNYEIGKNPLQIQIQLMFEHISRNIGFEDSLEALIEQSLSGYFVPFRSPRLKDLKYKKQAFEFGYKLWTNILQHLSPQLLISIDRHTYQNLLRLIPEVYKIDILNKITLSTGWGNYNADIIFFGSQSQIRLLRLPHLSTFKLFTSQQCSTNINQIFKTFCQCDR
jgi:hypothetical protein